jgi:hypothetical protein
MFISIDSLIHDVSATRMRAELDRGELRLRLQGNWKNTFLNTSSFANFQITREKVVEYFMGKVFLIDLTEQFFHWNNFSRKGKINQQMTWN